MRVLGFHSFLPLREFEVMDNHWSGHDSAAVLVEDGRVIAAVEEERLNRVKHSSAFPARAIRRCLQQAGIELRHVDYIAVGCAEIGVDHYYLAHSLENATFPMGSGRHHTAALLEREFGVDVTDRLRFVPHHVAHLWSAFVPSGLESGLVASLDGSGDRLSGAVATFGGGRIHVLREYPVRCSLGHFYRECITLLGYTRFDEYKVMGLAPYGDPTTYRGLFEQLYTLLPSGEYELHRGPAIVRAATAAGLVGCTRRKGEPFTQTHRDFAAALQEALYRVVVHILEHFQRDTGARTLCLAGGVAHNCSVNGRLAYAGLFERIWVQPAAHDAGNALGAALAVSSEAGVRVGGKVMSHVYFGSDLPDDRELERTLARWSDAIDVSRPADVVEAAAAALAAGQVVGWVQGRSEFGPRALGNRSILADPRPSENKDRINQMVKKREAYRPFAPSVQVERVADFFDLPLGMTEAPFMTFALRVRPDCRSTLGAITHVDGTARLQTVSRETNPRYWSLLAAFERRSGIPMLLNTSFNNNAEPIVDSVDEAVTCFLTTGLDLLVVGDFVIVKRDEQSDLARFRALIPSIPSTHRLVVQAAAVGACRSYAIESTASRFFGEKTIPISPDSFSLLLAADGTTTLGALLTHLQGDADRIQAVVAELRDLWTRRVIVLHPWGGATSPLANDRLGRPDLT